MNEREQEALSAGPPVRERHWRCVDAAATEALGERLARILETGQQLWLRGALGSGKTTLVRGILHGLGHTGPVTSPTYTLVEPYALSFGTVFHFDLFRVRDPEELELLGIRDYMDGRALCLVEWPERASAMLAKPDFEIFLEITNGLRRIRCRGNIAAGLRALAQLS